MSIRPSIRSAGGGSGGGALTAIADFTATVDSYFQIDLAWTDSTDEESYLIEISDDGGTTYTFLAYTAAGTVTFSAIDLTAATLYNFRIRSLAGADVSPLAEASATTEAPALPTLGHVLHLKDVGTDYNAATGVWTDSSIVGNDAALLNAVTPPAIIADPEGTGHDAIRFLDSTEDELYVDFATEIGGWNEGQNRGGVYLVFKCADRTDSLAVFTRTTGDTDAKGNFGTTTSFRPFIQRIDTLNFVATHVSTDTVSSTGIVILGMAWKDDTLKAYLSINSTDYVETGDINPAGAVGSLQRLYLGASNLTDIDLFEVLVYDQVVFDGISLADHQTIMANLIARHT